MKTIDIIIVHGENYITTIFQENYLDWKWQKFHNDSWYTYFSTDRQPNEMLLIL